MATTTRIDPLKKQRATQWADFITRYHPSAEDIKDEASWYRWKQRLDPGTREAISDKLLQFKHDFEDLGGYDALGMLEENNPSHTNDSHNGGHGGGSSGHSTPQTATPTTTDDPATAEFSLPREVIPSEEAFTTNDGKETADAADQYIRSSQSATPSGDAVDRFLRSTQPPTPTADAAQSFLAKERRRPPAPETPEQTREREKSEAAKKIVRRFFKENPVNYHRALTQKYMPSDPRYLAMVEQEEKQNGGVQQGELGDAHAGPAHNDARDRFLAYHKGATKDYYQKERTQVYDSKREDPMWRASSVSLQQAYTKLTDPTNTYYAPLLAQLGASQIGAIGREVYTEQFVETFPEKAESYATEDGEIQQALQTIQLARLEDAEEGDDDGAEQSGEGGSEGGSQPDTFRMPSFPRRSPQPQPREREEDKKEENPKDKSHSHTRDEKQDKENPAKEKNDKDKKPSLRDRLNNNPYSKGKRALKNKINQGKQAAKKALKEGAKQLVQKGLGALAPYWGTALAIVAIVILLIIFLFILLGMAGQTAQENSETSAVPITVTKSVNKSEMKNPAELTPDEQLLTYTLSYTYGGKATNIFLADSLPEGTEFVSATGSYTLYDQTNQLTLDTKRAAKIVWAAASTEAATASGSPTPQPLAAVADTSVPTINNLGFGPSDGARIDAFIKNLKPQSPMIGKGSNIVERAREFNIDPLMVVFMDNESQFCSDTGVVSPGGSDPDNYNCGGIIWGAAQSVLTLDENALDDRTKNRWGVRPGPTANGHVFTFAPSLEDGIGLFFNYLGDSPRYKGLSLPEVYDIYNPCSDPGNGGKFACGQEKANKMLAQLEATAGPASTSPEAFVGTGGASTRTGAQVLGNKSYTLVLRVPEVIRDTYLINQASATVVGAETSTTTGSTASNPNATSFFELMKGQGRNTAVLGSQEEFVNAVMKNGSSRFGGNVTAENLRTIYTTAVAKNVNPLVLVTVWGVEQSYSQQHPMFGCLGFPEGLDAQLSCSVNTFNNHMQHFEEQEKKGNVPYVVSTTNPETNMVSTCTFTDAFEYAYERYTPVCLLEDDNGNSRKNFVAIYKEMLGVK